MDIPEFDLGLFRVLKALVRPLLVLFFAIEDNRAEALAGLEGPFVLLGNHSNWYDPFILVAESDGPLYFVATEDLFTLFPYGLFIGRLGAIPKVKFLPDLDTVKKLFAIRDAGHPVGIFPEGERNWDGRTLPFLPATLKLVRKLREPVAVVTLRGAHLSFPRWAIFPRRGKIVVDYRLIVSREEARSLSGEEVEARILAAFSHDDVEWNRGERVAFRGPFRTAGIEALLYLCPDCRGLGTIGWAMGARVRCRSCGAEHHLDMYGKLRRVGHGVAMVGSGGDGLAPPPSFADTGSWVDWQKATLPGLLEGRAVGGEGSALLVEAGVRLYRRERAGGKVRLALVSKGSLELFHDRISFAGKGESLDFPLPELAGVNVIYRNYLDFASGGQLYRLVPRSGSRCILVFLHAIRYLMKREGNETMGSEG